MIEVASALAGRPENAVRRVVLVDDHQLIRGGLRRAFEAADDFEVVGEAGLVTEAISVIDRVNLTMYAGDDQMFAALKAGASGFIGKDAPADGGSSRAKGGEKDWPWPTNE